MGNGTDAGRHWIGVDLGGSRIAAGVFDHRFHCLAKLKRSTKADRGAEAVTQRLERCILDVIDEADLPLSAVGRVGIGVPGTVAAKHGGAVCSGRLGWRDFPLGARVKEALGIPVTVENNCSLATLGVWSIELERQPRSLLGLFVGGSIGAGWVIDGRLCGGFAESAGQLGHWVLDPRGPVCRCGHRGCFDSLSSKQAVLDRVREAIGEGRETSLAEAIEACSELRGKDLRQAWHAGDSVVREVVGEAAWWLGVAIGRLVQGLRPDTVVLGGSLVDTFNTEVMTDIVNAARAEAPSGALERVRVRVSDLGKQATLIGAAWLAQEVHG